MNSKFNRLKEKKELATIRERRRVWHTFRGRSLEWLYHSSLHVWAYASWDQFSSEEFWSWFSRISWKNLGWHLKLNMLFSEHIPSQLFRLTRIRSFDLFEGSILGLLLRNGFSGIDIEYVSEVRHDRLLISIWNERNSCLFIFFSSSSDDDLHERDHSFHPIERVSRSYMDIEWTNLLCACVCVSTYRLRSDISNLLYGEFFYQHAVA